MNVKVIPVGALGANCVILWNDPAAVWIVDPGADGADIRAFLKEKGLVPAMVLITHGHFDHIGAIGSFPEVPLRISAVDLPMVGHPMNAWPPEYPAIKAPSNLVGDLVDGMALSGGGISAKVISTPGHTPGGVSFYFESESLLLTGDTLFAGSCGRTDFPGGSMDEMRSSLQHLMTLPSETKVICGHGMTTTIGRERESNPYIG